MDEDIGEFDYIVAHGVLTWVSPATRAALVTFARTKLKPGGLLFVSYNAMPGWGSVEPLRQLLLSPLSQDSRPGGPKSAEVASLERAKRGIEFARALQSAGAGYFVKNPSAGEMLDTMTRAGLPYVVHEYLHENWTPMYFARVAWEMSQADLHFVGVMPALLNFRDTAIPESAEKIFANVHDRLTFESLKDFALNETFRRDLYVKGISPRSIDATDAYLDETVWTLAAKPIPEDRVIPLPHRSVKLDAPIFEALLDVLSRGSETLATFAARPELAAFDLAALRGAMQRLLVAEVVVPMQRATRRLDAVPPGPFAVPSVYNQLMLRRLGSDVPIVMTSATAGTAFPLAALEGLAVRVLCESEPKEHEAWVRAFVGRSVLRLAEGDRVVEDRESQVRVILEKIEHVRSNLLPKLLELGILAPRS
jgi:hypothetical protein